jgi:predicted ATPase
MKIKTIQLRKFKRFDDLTIDLSGTQAKVVALVGPNGCGKSSVFDAFEQKLQDQVSASMGNIGPWYFSKSFFDATNPQKAYKKSEAVSIAWHGESQTITSKTFYVRSAYRFTPTLNITSIRAIGDPLADTERPGYTGNLDRRLQGNYERLHGGLFQEYQHGTKSGSQMKQELMGEINKRLAKVLDIRISSLGDVVESKGQLFFEKGSSKDFPFENLSAGEKEVVDLIIDLDVKRRSFDDTVFCIDEPELHLNTAIQRALLVELVDLIPDKCQLWVATHSVGFLRALQVELADKAVILDFSEKDYFNGAQTIRPIVPTHTNWRRIFTTALEDLTGLLAPETIIYCEGSTGVGGAGEELGLDAIVYNTIFESIYPTALFISSGGGGEQLKNSSLALKVLSKAFGSVRLLVLKDRDEKDDAGRALFLSQATANRMLKRREIENYLFDPEILSEYCQANQRTLDVDKYESLVPDVIAGDLKAGQTLQKLVQLCGCSQGVTQFKIALSSFVKPGTQVFSELDDCLSLAMTVHR